MKRLLDRVNVGRWPRVAGRKPTVSEVKKVVENGLAQAGTRNALVAAMAFREEGVSQPQVIAVVGKPHRNKIKQLQNLETIKTKVRQEGRIKFYHLTIVE